MSFLRKGTCVRGFTVVSRLDKGRCSYREVYLTTTPDFGQGVTKCVLVIYDYELTREAGKLAKYNLPYELNYMPLFLDEDVTEASVDVEEYVNRKKRHFLYTTYEYKEGKRLDQIDVEVDLQESGIEFFKELCRCTNYVHMATKGGGHNAISPENIIVYTSEKGLRPLLIDFSNVWKPVKRKKIFDVETLDHRFRAPETFIGGFSKYSDIYALGMMLCYIFGGEFIWDYSLAELRRMNEKQRRRACEEMRQVVISRASFPNRFYSNVASRALSDIPEDRYQSAFEMMLDLMYMSSEKQEFEILCNKLYQQEIENRESLFEKRTTEKQSSNNDSSSDDFDIFLDEVIKKMEAEDDIPQSTDDDSKKDNKSLSNDDDEADNLPFDDFGMKEDDGALKVNVDIVKRSGRGFADVAGMANLKQLLKRNFIDIIKHRDKAKMYNIQPSNGILLYGPPGCGKTYMAEKIAEEASLNFVMVKPSDLGSTYIHGSQTKIADLFKKAEKEAPALLCFDEFDTLVPSRKEDSHHSTLSEVNEFLVQLNNCALRGVYVLAMTNNINMIDGAVLRKGRIDEVIYVPEPDYEARREMFRLELDKCTLKGNDINFDKLADMTSGYTSSDIAFIVKEASREAFRLAIKTENLVNVDQSLLEKIIQQTSPSISEKDIKHYESMRDEFINKKKQIDIRPRVGFAV